MANTFKFGNGQWAVGKETALAYNDENSNFKPLPFDFDRGSTATVVNKNGLIETVGTDEPRIDFLNNTNGHLVIEPSRQNKMPSSEDFNGADWNRSFLTITSDDAISPYGTSTADKIAFTGNGSLRAWNTFTFTDAYTFSIFVKKGNSRYVTLRSFAFTTSAIIGFDLDNVTAQTGGVIEQYPNNWFRLSISKNISSDADKNGYFYFYLPNNLGSTTSVSGNYAYIFGNQIEEGSYATSYIPTSGSAVTRSADYTKILNSPILKATNQFTLFFDAKDFLLVNGTSTSFDDVMFVLGAGESAYDAGTSIHIYNRTWFYYNGSTADHIGVCYNALTDSKFAISYDGTKYTRYANGVKLGTFTVTASMANWDSITTGASNDAQGDERTFNLSNLQLYNTALSDSELQALTS